MQNYSRKKKAVAKDFVAHYEARVQEKSTVRGKAMFVCYNRKIAYALYKNILDLRPEWGVAKICDGYPEGYGCL